MVIIYKGDYIIGFFNSPEKIENIILMNGNAIQYKNML